MKRTLSTWLVAALAILAATPARADHEFNGVNMNGVNMNGVNMNGVNMNGVNMNGVNMNGVIMGNVTANVTIEGSQLTADLREAGSSCGHKASEIGGPLPVTCSQCANLVDGIHPTCGTSSWDATCVQTAQTKCRASGPQLAGTYFTGTLGPKNTPVTLYLESVQQAPLRIPTSHAGRAMSSPAVNLSSPAAGMSSPAVSMSSPAVNLSSPAVGMSSPALGVASPAVTTTALGFGSDVWWYKWKIRQVIGRRVNWVPACPYTDRDGLYNLAVMAAGRWVGRTPRPDGTVIDDCQPGD